MARKGRRASNGVGQAASRARRETRICNKQHAAARKQHKSRVQGEALEEQQEQGNKAGQHKNTSAVRAEQGNRSKTTQEDRQDPRSVKDLGGGLLQRGKRGHGLQDTPGGKRQEREDPCRCGN